ncbi:unnamed protein product [Rotaria sordida]|uniref:Uncharacterized protein n=1 Tax=Rotaria sordida TaxID=392033 RepID=A0A814KJW6_9BILA|nr:unnamed protein product [Rotaria sordida]CAF1053424.1 unnamed protein product [Rotaria sordida]CAF3799111.1 unnamed protein product [Rotaria sordida]CAF3954431.1 unnamed protein product [Rotaria sordida]
MLKLFIFTIFLFSSPIFGLLETLFQAQNNCYSRCHSNYDTSLSNLDACKKGCDYKLHNEDCTVRCKLLPTDEQIQASCLAGCSSNHSPEIKESIENERPRSIILIRLRQRPLSEHSPFNIDRIRMFINKIRKFNENRNIIKQSNEIQTDSLNDENTYKITRFIIHQKDNIESRNNRFKQFLNDIHSEWNDLIHKQPKISIWICFVFLLLSSIILWHMIVSLCHHTPRHHTLSTHAQELAVDNIYEKEKL